MIHQIRFKRSEVLKFSPLSTSDLRIASGEAWVTKAGCDQDMILEAGAVLPISGSEILIQSLSDDLVLEYKPNPRKKFRFHLRELMEKSHLVSPSRDSDDERQCG